MSRYIDVDKLLKSTISKYRCVPLVGIHTYRNGEEYFDGEDFDDLINNTPTADVVEVRHGEWIEDKHRWNPSDWRECSLCGYYFDVSVGQELTAYCPNCGAKMDGERKEE